MKKHSKLLGLAVAASALFGGAANAQAEPTFNVGVATDYLFRGIDQTSPISEGQAFGGVDVSSGQLYAGAWVSNTGPHLAQFFEYDIYGGWKPTAGPVTFDLGFIYYGYTDTDDTFADESELSTYELKVGASVAAGGVTWTGNVFWTPNFSGDFDGSDDNSGLYYEVIAAYTFSNSATLSGGVGAVSLDEDIVVGLDRFDSYVTYNIGVTYPITEQFSIDARYIGTDDDATDGFGGNGDTLVGTLKLTF